MDAKTLADKAREALATGPTEPQTLHGSQWFEEDDFYSGVMDDVQDDFVELYRAAVAELAKHVGAPTFDDGRAARGAPGWIPPETMFAATWPAPEGEWYFALLKHDRETPYVFEVGRRSQRKDG